MQASPWFSHVRLARYAANGRMREHVHDTASLCLLAGGRYQECIRGRGDWHAPGEMMFCPANESHAQVFAGNGALKILIDVRPGALDYLRGCATLSDAPSAGSAQLASIARRLRTELSGEAGDATARLARSIAALFNPILYPDLNRHLEITQEEIGALSGISRQNANQCLKRLEKEGLLRLEYGGVTILDLDRLRSYGE